MSQVIKLKKGLDIRLEGEPRRELKRLPLVHAYAVRPDDFLRHYAETARASG